ncbi:MAG: ATP-binding protein [Bacteroidales bacterium]|nr:ATP-binding protein [Bacteroidales bacterium]
MYTSIANNGLTVKDKMIENYYILNQIVQSIDTGVIVIYEKKLVLINNEAKRIFGRTYKELETNLSSFFLANQFYQIKKQFVSVLKNYIEKAEFVTQIQLPNGFIKNIKGKFVKIKIVQTDAIFFIAHELSQISIPCDTFSFETDFWKKYVVQYSSMFSKPYDVVLVIDKNFVVKNISESVENFVGVKRELFIGHRFNSILKVEPIVDIIETIKDFSKVAENSNCRCVKNLEITILLPNGSSKTFAVSVSIINIVNNFEGFCFVARQINKQNNEVAFSTEELAANIAHEFRSPLNAIIGFSNIISDETLPISEKKIYLKFIKQSCNSLLNLVNDFCDFSKLNQNKIVISENNFDINKLFEELYAYCKIYCVNYRKKNISIIQEKQYPEGEFMIYADFQRIKQIMINLLCNAFKFTEKGSITFKYQIVSKNIILSVIDTGVGIPEEMQSKIFARFTQVGGFEKNEGLGLGLSITKNLVELMKGTIEVKSTYGYGSEFIVKLPFKLPHVNSMPTIKSNVLSYNFSGKKIIIAEDSQINFILLQKILSKTQVEIIWAQNGEICVDFFKKNPDTNLILMDMQMPIKDGFEAAKDILKIDDTVPIIAQTAYSMADEKNRILSSGCIDYISKPIDREELLRKINSVIR